MRIIGNDKNGHQSSEEDSGEEERRRTNDFVINIIPPENESNKRLRKYQTKENQDDDDEGRRSLSTDEIEYSSTGSFSSSDDDESSSSSKTKNHNCKRGLRSFEQTNDIDGVIAVKSKNNFNWDLGYDSGVNTHDEDEDSDKDDGKRAVTVTEYQREDQSEDLKILFDGLNEDVSTELRDKKPDWFDENKYRSGQRFAEKYYFCVNFAEMISLFMLFSYDLTALMFTDKSGTPYTAFKRYLSTVSRVKSWFETDIFDTESAGYSNIKTVRAMHRSVEKKLSALTRAEIDATIDRYNDRTKFKCPLKESVREDFQNSSSCPFAGGSGITLPEKAFSQCTMSVTQFGFVGLIVTYPEKLGVGTATEEELEGFVHLWKTIGYLLGIDDKYNFCEGSLADVRRRSKNLIEKFTIPNFGRVTEDWEHYSRCVVEGISFYVPDITFETSMLHLCYVLDVDAKQIRSKVSWKAYFHYALYKFMCGYLFRSQWILNFFNRLLNKSLNRARNFPQEKLERIKTISDKYMTSSQQEALTI